MKWSAIDKNEPERNKEYLVVAVYEDGEPDPVKSVETAYLSRSGHWQYQNGDMDYHHDKDDCEYRVITHWMPLPEPPNE